MACFQYNMFFYHMALLVSSIICLNMYKLLQNIFVIVIYNLTYRMTSYRRFQKQGHHYIGCICQPEMRNKEQIYNTNQISFIFGVFFSLVFLSYFFIFQRSTFVASAWSFGFFIPATTANDLRLRRISITDLIHYIFSYLNS